jgi:hypothetical protein
MDRNELAALVSRVEHAVGMSHAAWDTIPPADIAQAFIEALAPASGGASGVTDAMVERIIGQFERENCAELGDWERQIVRAALQATQAPDVGRLREALEEARYVGLHIGRDCALALAELQESGVYKPRCDDGRPSNADARRDVQRIEECTAKVRAALEGATHD